MSELKPQPPLPTGQSTTIVGVSNFVTPADPFRQLPTYGVTSYTVANVGLPTDTGAPSQPLSAGAVRVVNSVLNARVPENSILRDNDEDF